MAPLKVGPVFGRQIYGSRRLIPQYNDALTTAILEQLSRIRHLSLTKFGTRFGLRDMEGVVADLSTPCPLLETLTICFNIGDEPKSRLPDNVFSGEAPRLTHLELQSCGLNWQSPILSNLKFLKINLQRHRDGTKSSLVEVMSALSEMPDLEELDLRAAFTSTHNIVVHNSTINLRRLSYLLIESDLHGCTSLFESLVYPVGTPVAVRCNTALDLASMIHPVRRLAQALSKGVRPIKKLSVSGVAGTANLMASPSPSSPRNNYYHSQRLFDLDVLIIPANRSSETVTAILTELLKPFLLGKLERLLISGVEFDRKTLIGRFGHLKLLKTVTLEHASGFLSAFTTGIPSQPSQEWPTTKAGRLQFVALRSINLQDWIFDGPHTARGSPIEALIHCLKERRKRGIPLRELYVDDCQHITSADISELSRVVKKVEWNEPEYWTEVLDDDAF